MSRVRSILTLGLFLPGLSCAPLGSADANTQASGPVPTDHDYWVYVGAESADRLHRIRFGPNGARVEATATVGEIPVEIEGPHGVAIARNEGFLYLTTGHGVPDGKLWKYDVGIDTVAGGPIDLGFFPATVDVTSDGSLAFIANFNLHGEMDPSSISIVETEEMYEVARVETCTMPHGSRISPDGRRHYSGCMMDDQLVEIDTRTFEVTRRFSVAVGDERPLDTNDRGHHAPAAHGDHPGHVEHGSHYEASCSPTWADTDPLGSRVYVACNLSDEVLEIDVDGWTLNRRFSTGRGPYNLEVTPDGRTLVVTLKQGSGVEFIDLEEGHSLARSETSTTVTHGVVVSPDSRYAFVSVEGVGAEPGKVDVYDLTRFERVADVEVGQQAAGIAFWKMEPAAQ